MIVGGSFVVLREAWIVVAWSGVGDKDLGHMVRFPWIVRLIYSQQVI